MSFFTSDAMRDLDAAVIESGTSGIVLMGRAARGLAEEILFFHGNPTTPVVVVCGPGNNGGDGFGLALHLHLLGRPVEIWGAIFRGKVKGDALTYCVEAEQAGVRFRWFPESSDWNEAERFLPPGAVLVDCLLGTGSSGAPRKQIGTAVEFFQDHRDRHGVVAVDLPSGLDADTGEPFDDQLCVRADHTFTLGGAKKGFVNDVSAERTGSVSVIDLAFDENLLREKAEPGWRTLGRREASALLSARSPDEHKGTRGHVLVAGGSPGMTGSVSMSARAALRTGSGLVSVLTPFYCTSFVDISSPEIMAIPGRAGLNQALCTQAVPFDRKDAVLLGPGMLVNPDTQALTERVVMECPCPLVLDADALSHVSKFPEWFTDSDCEKYLTPHPGELAGMMGTSIRKVQADRAGITERAADQGKCSVVLKGSRSRMVNAGGGKWLNVNGNPGMATAGAGDVLAGMVVSLAGQGIRRDRVLPLAVYLHGRAGDLAAARKGQAGMLAGDILDAIPAVMRYVQGR